MSKQSTAVKNWRNKTKELILCHMGSRCVLCGYNKSSNALELHHLDKTTKLFNFGGLRANPMSWSIVIEELKKCILVCSNCHREIESGIVDVSTMSTSYVDVEDIDNSLQNQVKRNLLKVCVNSDCKTSFRAYHKNQLYCSVPCRQNKSLVTAKKHPVRKTKIKWPGHKLLQKMVDEFGYVRVGNKLGVSDNAVRKRLNKYSQVA